MNHILVLGLASGGAQSEMPTDGEAGAGACWEGRAPSCLLWDISFLKTSQHTLGRSAGVCLSVLSPLPLWLPREQGPCRPLCGQHSWWERSTFLQHREHRDEFRPGRSGRGPPASVACVGMLAARSLPGPGLAELLWPQLEWKKGRRADPGQAQRPV